MNVAINTNLTDVIRGAISQLGGDARLVKATATKALQVPWFMGSSSGKSIPRSFSKPHVESFTRGEKILLVRKGDEFYYYNDDTDQWYMLNTKELLKHFTIEDSIRADVSKPYQENKITFKELFDRASEFAKSIDGKNQISVRLSKEDNNTVGLWINAVERRTDYLSLLKEKQRDMNNVVEQAIEFFKSLPGVIVTRADKITSQTLRDAEYSTEYSEYETNVNLFVKATIK